MKAEVLNVKTEKSEAITLNDEIWAVAYNPDLIAQVVNIYRDNKRKASSHAKTRGDVSGGGKKPWRQKGTGRARQGSIRSPLWVKGGVTFAPSGRNWKKRINKKMVEKAIKVVLSERLRDGSLKLISIESQLKLSDYRNAFVNIDFGKSAVVITDKEDLQKALRNVSVFSMHKPLTISVLDMLGGKSLVIDVDSIKVLEGRLVNEK